MRIDLKRFFAWFPAKFIALNLGRLRGLMMFRNRDLLVKILVVILVLGMLGSLGALFVQ